VIDWDQVEHFTPSEFECACCSARAIQPALVFKLDELRTRYGKPLIVTSGYRCPEHNVRVSTRPVSQLTSRCRVAMRSW
jgi:uncharacterized protein YcbK (DUF882 family)